jgi:hypothetical protein
MLHAEGPCVRHCETLDRAVVEVDVGDTRLRSEALLVDCEAVILGRDFDFAGGDVFHRLIRSTVAEFHLLQRVRRHRAKG